MKNLTFENRFFAAVLFSLLIAFIAMIFSCCAKPAERVIRSVSPAVFRFQPEYNYLIDNVAVNIDSSGNVTRFTDPYDNRWARPNGYVYSEQIEWQNLYFTDLTIKQQFDFPRIYGFQMPEDTLKAHAIFKANDVISLFYQLHEISGSNYTVEQIDWFIESGQLDKRAKRMKP